MEKHMILGIHIENRVKQVGGVQEILSEYGCSIRTRIGLHDVRDDYCSPSGVILLELTGDESECMALAEKLNQFDGVETQAMIFKKHD